MSCIVWKGVGLVCMSTLIHSHSYRPLIGILESLGCGVLDIKTLFFKDSFIHSFMGVGGRGIGRERLSRPSAEHRA